jgi:hypothetical protein
MVNRGVLTDTFSLPKNFLFFKYIFGPGPAKDKDNSRSPSGMTTRKATATAMAMAMGWCGRSAI